MRGDHLDVHQPGGTTGGWRMAVITRGYGGRRRDATHLPPGQYPTDHFPVMSAGPTPRIDLDELELAVVTETGERSTWSWAEFTALPADEPTVDIHCVTHWSKLDTSWRGVSVDTLLADIGTAAEYVVAHSYSGYTAQHPAQGPSRRPGLGGLRVPRRAAREPVHGGPARLLVPHLTSGRARNGCARWNCVTTTTPDSGRQSATTSLRASGIGSAHRSEEGGSPLCAKAAGAGRGLARPCPCPPRRGCCSGS